MGLINRRSLFLLSFFGFAISLQAAPMLRLVNSVVGPVSIATGASGVTQTLEAYNIGDGALSLSLNVPQSAPWLTAAVGDPRGCSTTSDSATCIPLQFKFDATGLSVGKYSATVTVSDPNAVDAPQTVIVSIQVGGGVPSTVDQYVAPGTTRDVPFTTNSLLTAASNATDDGGSWLSLTLDGTGSFRFVLPYRVHLAPPADMAPGTYTGKLVIVGSRFDADNTTIAVTMRVTTDPIAVPSPDHLSLRLAQNGPALSSPYLAAVNLSNAGQGTLAVQDMSVSGGSGALSVTNNGGAANLTVTPGSLAPGVYNDGVLTISCNAVNCPVKVPVTFEIVPQGPPVISFQGAVDNATSVPGDPVAPGDLMTLKGEQLSLADPSVNTTPPLSMQIGGASVTVNGEPAPLIYSSFGLVGFQMPTDIAPGIATVQAQRDGQNSNLVSVNVAPRAPRIFAVTNPDGSPNGADGSHPANVGDQITIYAIGLGATDPAVTAGNAAPSDPPAAVQSAFTVLFGPGLGGVNVTPDSATLVPGQVGVYQVKVTVPPESPRGVISVAFVFDDVLSNPGFITIQQ